MLFEDLSQSAKLRALKQIPNGHTTSDYRFTEDGIILVCVRDQQHQIALEELLKSVRFYDATRDKSHIEDILYFAEKLKKTM